MKTTTRTNVVTLKIPDRLVTACEEYGITPAAFIRAITEDALENPEIARELIRDLFPANKGKVQAYADNNGLATTAKAPAAKSTESGARILPFLPHRIKRNWNLPAV